MYRSLVRKHFLSPVFLSVSLVFSPFSVALIDCIRNTCPPSPETMNRALSLRPLSDVLGLINCTHMREIVSVRRSLLLSHEITLQCDLLLALSGELSDQSDERWLRRRLEQGLTFYLFFSSSLLLFQNDDHLAAGEK